MVALSVLFVLVVLAIPVLIIVLLVGQSNLKTRVSALETRLAEALSRASAALSAQPPVQPIVPAAPATEPVGPWAAAAEVSVPPVPPPTVTVPPVTFRDLAPPQADPTVQDGPIVMRADRANALAAFLQRNWIYVVSAASLALAGVFLVQYSVQNGFLPPAARVIAAYLFGAGLVGAGEWVRRRKGDGAASATEFLPSVFSGAGIVTLFAATIAAQQLYGLIGANLAFVLHALTAALAVVLGWFHGPLLVAVGLLGAAAAPFLVATGAGPTPLLYAYYALIAAAGLAVDAVRRWAWLSVLALVLGYGGAALMMMGGAGSATWLVFLLALPALAIVLPPLRVIPDHPGPATLQSLGDNGKGGWPVFPVRLAAGSVLASALAMVLLPGDTALTGLLVLAALTLMAISLLIWAKRAEGLADLALLPAAALVLRLYLEVTQYWPFARDILGQTIALRPPETSPPISLSLVVALAALISAAFAIRALRKGPMPVVHGLGAVLTAPVVVAVLDLLLEPALILGPMLWALHPMALAAAMVALAARFAAVDGEDRRRMAHAVLSALSLIALSLFILTSATALTLALAALVVAAAWLDRRFTLPEMGLFIQIAVAVIAVRLLIDPGLDWAMAAPLFAVIACFGGVILAQVAGCHLLKGKDRIMTSGVLESAAMATAAVLANVLLTRWLVPDDALGSVDLNYVASLNALPWLVLALTQAYRAGLGPTLRPLRIALAGLGGLLAGAGLLWSALPLNPLFASHAGASGALVTGPLVLDTLALSYAAPGLILLLAAWRLRFGPRLTLGLVIPGSALLALYLGLEIRRFWQGDYLGNPGVTQYELYSYTLALMLLGAALLYQSIARRATTLRRVAMAVIALVIAKVFLIDAAGLTGLTRVFSFLGLGLSLAGLAWLNRWAGQAAQGGQK